MNRGMMGMATMVALCVASQSADAQVYIYDAPTTVYVPGGVYSTTVYPQPVVVQSGAVVSSNYYAPAYAAPAGVVQMSYRSPVLVPARTVIAAPVVVGPTVVRDTTRVTRHNFTHTVRTNGPAGPHYSRVHVHSGLFGTTIRERAR